MTSRTLDWDRDLGSYADRLARAIADVFRTASVSHGGLVYSARGQLTKIGTYRHATDDVLAALCDRIVHVGRHPALELARHRATPFVLLTSPDRPMDEPNFQRFTKAVGDLGISRVFLFPLRNSRGDLFVASGARHSGIGWAEARLVHSFCLAALAEVDAFFLERDAAGVLTERERACLNAAARGMTEKESARELGISPSTVHAHLENCKRKLGVRNKTEAVVRAIRIGAIDASEI